MRRTPVTFLSVLFCLCALSLGAQERSEAADQERSEAADQERSETADSSLVTLFRNPPRAARPYLWWHWMDGNVNKEGVRKDLEWMHRIGIGGFQQFDAGGVNMPRAIKDKKPYMSEGWKEVFRYALGLADSLGFEVGIAAAPGYSSSGGPWVSPEDAMKKLEWKSVDVDGGSVRVRLPKLDLITGPYQDFETLSDRIEIKPFGRDLFVVAVKLPDSDKTMSQMGARVDVCDSLIVCEFPKPQTIKAFTLQSYAMGGRPRSGGEPQYRNVLECSDDGLEWIDVKKVSPCQVPYITETIEPTRARFFRARGEKLRSLELFTVTKINHSQELGGFSVIHDLGKFHTPPSADAISLVIDLTDKVDTGGRLNCKLPKGRWRIYRFGSSLTGKTNHPASPEATGLEVDKHDPDAWSRYFRTYFEMYKEAAGGLLGRRGITHLLIDSFEAGSTTWTPLLPEEFERRRGYSLVPWLPVLAGEVIESSSRSERFLMDWRKTLGELFEENYLRVSEIANEYGLLGRYTESHEGAKAFIGDGMRVKSNSTVPMAAIWMEDTPAGSKIPSAIADIKESASVAHIYGQNLVAAESFTVSGDEGRAYTYHPGNMKYMADVAMWAGVNRFVIHESASQPNDAYLPGLQLFRYGQWFHRNETWAEQAGVLTDYLARSCQLLQTGRSVADVLLYYGEDSNATAQYGGDSFESLPQLPSGYDYDFANPQVLLEDVSLSGKALRTKMGNEYAVLWIDRNFERASVEVLERLRDFVEAGFVICAEAPTICSSGSEKEFKSLVSEIWGKGRRNVVSEISEALRLAGKSPDFHASSVSSALSEGLAALPVRYVHRTLEDGSEIYWVRNFSEKDTTFDLSFRSGGAYASIFIPETGKVFRVKQREAGGKTLVRVPMLSTDAFFVVFSKEELSNEDFSQRQMTEPRTLDCRWSVRFEQKNGGTADEVFDKLVSWTEKDDPVVKYFSGTAVYKASFELTEADLSSAQGIALDLGDVRNLAEVFVNGQALPVLWKAPFVTDDILPLLKEGTNSLEIKVTNVWRNRMIGDVQPGVKRPVTAIRRFYKSDAALLPSGLLGPVRLLRIED